MNRMLGGGVQWLPSNTVKRTEIRKVKVTKLMDSSGSDEEDEIERWDKFNFDPFEDLEFCELKKPKMKHKIKSLYQKDP